MTASFQPRVGPGDPPPIHPLARGNLQQHGDQGAETKERAIGTSGLSICTLMGHSTSGGFPPPSQGLGVSGVSGESLEPALSPLPVHPSMHVCIHPSSFIHSLVHSGFIAMALLPAWLMSKAIVSLAPTCSPNHCPRLPWFWTRLEPPGSLPQDSVVITGAKTGG